jgi:hypothetical protein
MTQASLQIDFQPRPRVIAVVTSTPISSIIENGRYSAFQDLIDGYVSSFAKVIVVSPSGRSNIAAKKADRVTWLSGPRWLPPLNGLWWAALENRRELREVDLVRTFGPRAGIVGRAVSKFSKSPFVSSADDLTGNDARFKTGWRAIVPKFVNRLGVLKADVLSATLNWELEYLAESDYTGDLMLGARGLPTDIYTPIGTTDPDRHPVVLWADGLDDDDSVLLVQDVAASTQKLIPNVEFIVVAEGDAADRLASAAATRDLPVIVATPEEVEPLVDLIERTWACVTVPTPRKNTPYGLAMLTLSAGKPLISIGNLGENHGFLNHLNYIRVDGRGDRSGEQLGSSESEEVAYDLQLLRRWSSFALRIGLAGQRLIEGRYSTRSVAMVEGERLARIAIDLNVDAAMSDGARALKELAGEQPIDVEQPEGASEPAGIVEHESSPGAEEVKAGGLDLVAAAIAAANGEGRPEDAIDGGKAGPVEPVTELDAGSETDGPPGADIVAALFGESDLEEIDVSDEFGDSSEQAEAVGIGDIEEVSSPPPDITVTSESTSTGVDDDLPQINLIKINAGDTPPAGGDELSAVAEFDDPISTESVDSGEPGQDAISALFAREQGGDQPGTPVEPAESDTAEIDDPGPLDPDTFAEIFAEDDEIYQFVEEIEPSEPTTAENDNPGPLDQDAISALFASDDETDRAA